MHEFISKFNESLLLFRFQHVRICMLKVVIDQRAAYVCKGIFTLGNVSQVIIRRYDVE